MPIEPPETCTRNAQAANMALSEGLRELEHTLAKSRLHVVELQQALEERDKFTLFCTVVRGHLAHEGAHLNGDSTRLKQQEGLLIYTDLLWNLWLASLRPEPEYVPTAAAEVVRLDLAEHCKDMLTRMNHAVAAQLRGGELEA